MRLASRHNPRTYSVFFLSFLGGGGVGGRGWYIIGRTIRCRLNRPVLFRLA